MPERPVWRGKILTDETRQISITAYAEIAKFDGSTITVERPAVFLDTVKALCAYDNVVDVSNAY